MDRMISFSCTHLMQLVKFYRNLTSTLKFIDFIHCFEHFQNSKFYFQKKEKKKNNKTN